MPAGSPDNAAEEMRMAREALSAREIPWGRRLLMLALNFLPLAHAALITVVLLGSSPDWRFRVANALGVLYLLPPLTARLVLRFVPIPQGRIAMGSRAFFAWWTTFQLQVIFCRLTFLEEMLRLVPGLYSLWLRLWGSRIGRLTYWSPGTTITDRSFLRIGDDVVFGAGVRLNAHVLAKNKSGAMELILAEVKIGDGAVVGGYSLLTAGTEIAP
ncbi:MAG TPA: hypothetical protein VG733_20270, partial [Chthoniobacteraceae bacterium]|nr:hypothetical protein [Chthoniobacteraceae bacterium]